MTDTDRKCSYYYKFSKEDKALCLYSGQPQKRNNCIGINCGHYTKGLLGFESGGSFSSGDSFRRAGSDRHHDSNE